MSRKIASLLPGQSSARHLANAWISDRTLCYLASGKPAVVEDTGPSRILPDAEGLFRFGTLDEAARALAAVESDYGRHARLARKLAEEHFDARKIAGRVLERALAGRVANRSSGTASPTRPSRTSRSGT